MRAALREPELLILDEATANTDTVTEELLQEILRKLPATTTKVIIAHRLNTIDNVDQIFRELWRDRTGRFDGTRGRHATAREESQLALVGSVHAQYAACGAILRRPSESSGTFVLPTMYGIGLPGARLARIGRLILDRSQSVWLARMISAPACFTMPLNRCADRM